MTGGRTAGCAATLGACGFWPTASCESTFGAGMGEFSRLWGLAFFCPAKSKKNEKQYHVTGLNVTSLSQCMNISGFTGCICFKSPPLLF